MTSSCPDVTADSPATSPEQQLERLGITLPPPPAPLGAYAPWVVTKSLIMTSGQFPWVDGRLAYVGKIGSEISLEDGYEACRLAAINAIAQLKSAAGSLSHIRRIVRLEGTMQVAAGFREGPSALNGASDLINTVFGGAGLHSRMIYTNPEMPLDTPVLLVILAEMQDD